VAPGAIAPLDELDELDELDPVELPEAEPDAAVP
jgi:hypothetical protein